MVWPRLLRGGIRHAPVDGLQPIGPRAGGGVHFYRDVRNGQGGFQMYELGALQLVPIFAERGVLELTARTWLTHSSRPEEVPFYLMPTLGGGDYLRAFPTYRFRDREAGYLKAEYRWAVHKAVDVAGFFEGGKVAPEVKTRLPRHGALGRPRHPRPLEDVESVARRRRPRP